MVSFQCPSCGKRLKVKAEIYGKRARCPLCRTAVLVPAAFPGDDLQSRPADEPPSICEAVTLAPSDPSQPDGDTHLSGAESRQADRHLFDFLAPPQCPDELGRLGTYRVLKVLGHGGMGVVFEAEDPQLRRKVALKAMLPTLAASETARQRFLREAQSAAAIEHDHIVHIYQVGEDRGVPFIAMAFLKGESLDQRLARQKRLPLPEVVRIGRETAAGLAAAHKQGLIHRDIKPANLWLEVETGRVKILDFGLARAASDTAHLTQSGAIVGTPSYMAPEQVNGQTLDARCDLFSVGCVLYQLSTSELPFKGSDTISTLIAVATEQPRPPREISPALPQEFSDLVMKLLAKVPAQRTASAQALLEGLAGIQEQRVVPTMSYHGTVGRASAAPAAVRKPGSGRRQSQVARQTRKNRLLWGVAIGALACLVLAGLIVVYIATDKGELVIETDDPNIEVVVAQGGKQVTIIDVQTKQQIKLASGTYELELAKGGEGLRLSTDKFTLTRGGREIVRVRREVASPKKPAGTLTRQVEAFVPLFNGKDLTGWHVVRGDADDWQIEQGGIGFTGADKAHPSILASDQEYTDYAVRFEFQADDKAIAGFAVRSVPGRGARDIAGGSIAIAADKRAGSFYWGRAGDYLSSDPKPQLQPPENWNRMEIRLHGRRLRVLVNGAQVQNLNLDQIPDRPIARPYLKRSQGTIEFGKIVGTVHMRNIEWCDLSNTPPPTDAVSPAKVVTHPQGKQAVGFGGDAQWRGDGDELVQAELNKHGCLFFGDVEWSDYDFSCEAMRVAGPHGFDIIVRATDKYNFYILTMGGWGNTKHAWSSVNEWVFAEFKGWRNAKVNANQWYQIRVSVRGPRCQCFLDDKLLFDFTDPNHLRGAVGFSTYETKVRFRNIKVTAPDGKILWEGVPELDALERARR